MVSGSVDSFRQRLSVDSFREWLVIYLKGFFMGSADTVPGVSGGTIALITGIYERLIEALTAIDPRLLGDVARVHEPEGREAVRTQLIRMDIVFLLTLGVGMMTAVVSLSHALERAVDTYPAPTYAFFFGLIGASAAVLYEQVDVTTPKRVAVAVAGVTLAAAVTGEASAGVSHALPVILLAGALAVCAMILPGVSGAFLLILVGQYEYMLGALNRFTDALADLASGGSVAAVVDAVPPVVTFVTGALAGLLTLARVIDWALSNYRVATLTFLVSLMVGGLRLPAERVVSNGGVTALTVLAAVAGGLLVLGVDHFTDDLEYA
jgi:putative membrane protein